ncbi:MAG: hypothetical protein M0C28_03565 [Candidatus Moduliflexus flocculans]|nr:hypothetical protein [Candidatus Moduliflexus flocculans]
MGQGVGVPVGALGPPALRQGRARRGAAPILRPADLRPGPSAAGAGSSGRSSTSAGRGSARPSSSSTSRSRRTIPGRGTSASSCRSGTRPGSRRCAARRGSSATPGATIDQGSCAKARLTKELALAAPVTRGPFPGGHPARRTTRSSSAASRCGGRRGWSDGPLVELGPHARRARHHRGLVPRAGHERDGARRCCAGTTSSRRTRGSSPTPRTYGERLLTLQDCGRLLPGLAPSGDARARAGDEPDPGVEPERDVPAGARRRDGRSAVPGRGAQGRRRRSRARSCRRAAGSTSRPTGRAAAGAATRYLDRKIERNAMHKQNTLSMFWTAEALLAAWRATGRAALPRLGTADARRAVDGPAGLAAAVHPRPGARRVRGDERGRGVERFAPDALRRALPGLRTRRRASRPTSSGGSRRCKAGLRHDVLRRRTRRSRPCGRRSTRGSGRPTTASRWRTTATAAGRAPSRRGHGRVHDLRLGQRRRGRGRRCASSTTTPSSDRGDDRILKLRRRT